MNSTRAAAHLTLAGVTTADAQDFSTYDARADFVVQVLGGDDVSGS